MELLLIHHNPHHSLFSYTYAMFYANLNKFKFSTSESKQWCAGAGLYQLIRARWSWLLNS